MWNWWNQQRIRWIYWLGNGTMKIKPGADLRLSLKVEQLCFPEDVQEFVSLVKFCFAISP